MEDGRWKKKKYFFLPQTQAEGRRRKMEDGRWKISWFLDTFDRIYRIYRIIIFPRFPEETGENSSRLWRHWILIEIKTKILTFFIRRRR
jgi:hypothetical protein